MRLAVVGSRDFARLDRVDEYLRGLDIECVISGGARGVDRESEQWARDHHLPVVSFRVFDRHDGWFNIERWEYGADGAVTSGSPHRLVPPRGQAYRSFGAAAYVRNRYIVEFADQVVAFWNGHSPGTKHSISLAREMGNLREVVRE